MNIRPKSKSKMSIVKPYSTKSKKIRKKSPKIIDYNKVAQKYGNLLETSLNTSNSTQPQKALNSNNNIDDSYYDYIIDNIYETNKIENTKNDDSYYFTFKKKPNTINNNSNNTSGMNINKNKYKNKAPISIISNKEEMNKYFNDKNNKNNNLNNVSSIKNYNNMYNTFNKQVKRTKTLKTNLSYKNDNYNNNQFKKIEKVSNTNYKTNKSHNNIRLKENNNKEIKEVKDIKENPKPKRLNRINSQENNFSKKFNINNNNNYYKIIRNSESIQVQGNECIKEEVLNNNNNNKIKKINNTNNNTNANINNKLKEKVILLLNLCRKYAYKFNKLFPLCESNISDDSRNQSLVDLKNTIIQYNNMIFNQNITKIFQLDDNKNEFLNINLLNENEMEKLNIKINELSNQIKVLKQNELIYKENINNLSQKIEILNNELNDKEIIIQELKNKINIKSGKVKEFHGLGENNEDININNINKINEVNNSNKKNNSNNKNNINSYNKSNKHNINREMIQIEEIKNNINNKLNLETDEDKPLNTEIEKLDQEIFNLKSKLKKIIIK